MALWNRVTSASSRVLSLSVGCVGYAGRQCYSLVSSVPSFLPQRTTLIAREYRAPPPPLPEPKYLEIKGCCKLEYVEIRPYAAKIATVILVHGAPGSYRDFRYLIPLLAEHPGLRIIGINLPGCGDSVVEKARYIETVDALRTSEVVLDGVRQLCGTKEDHDDVFLVGHSFGAHAVLNMAALNAAETQSVAIRGMALLAPAGCVPHKSLKLGATALMVKMFKSENSWAVSAATYITKFVYTKLLRFPSNSPSELFVSAVIRTGTTDFDLIRDQAKLLGSFRTPTLIAWAKNDEHIQPEIPQELATLCPDGPHLEFSGGGHNLQKTRADEISKAIIKWVNEVVAKDKLDEELVSTAASPRVVHEPQSPPPPLPDPKYLQIDNICKIEYVDVEPQQSVSATVVCVHGAPGSFRDYRYLIPMLAEQQRGIRLIGVNLPGYMGSEVEKAHYLKTVSALRAAEVVLQAIRQLCGTIEMDGGDIFLVGHSFGAHTVINMAAMNETLRVAGDDVNTIRLRGIAVLAPAGCVPQRMVKEIPIKMLVTLLRSRSTVVVRLATRFVKYLYTELLGFPRRTPATSCVSAVIRAGTTKFPLIRTQVNFLKEMKMPVFVAWALDDVLVEPEIPEELGKLSHPGPRLEFAGGGHNIQKTRVEQVTAAMSSWIQSILSECNSLETGMTQHLP
ncbi:Alpha/beta hydrolase [Phytophthora infestans]|uniref:Alpha/beta hydrolase n=1 Tax=Phytophthora infestans TaxID=4787 RepID=A0A833W1M7_PHYIN|nr:Alpha/beta hydrolase [Phytophthora infestans]